MSRFLTRRRVITALLVVLFLLLLVRVFLVNQIRFYAKTLYHLELDQHHLQLEFEYLQSQLTPINASGLEKQAMDQLHMTYPMVDE